MAKIGDKQHKDKKRRNGSFQRQGKHGKPKNGKGRQAASGHVNKYAQDSKADGALTRHIARQTSDQRKVEREAQNPREEWWFLR